MKKRVLVTGADGFIGSHLAELLCQRGYTVRALACYNSLNHWGWLEDVASVSEIEVITGDVRDPHFCLRLTQGVDQIFHLAALIGIPFSYHAPDTYLDTNVKGTVNLCQAALRNGCERMLQTSTSEVYGTARYVPIDELHPLQPQSPYSASKIAADAMAMSFHLSAGLPLTVVRPFNTYGPRQSARAVIPTIISQIASGASTVKLGAVSPTRDFTYVLDTCRGFLALAECAEAVGETVNVGSNYEISIGETFRLICQLMGAQAEPSTEHERLRPAQSEVERLWCDNSKLKRLTGFAPEWSFEKGLQRTIDWFQQPDNLKKYKPSIYNV